MKTPNQVRITNENVRITAENVQHIGECIALSAIKIMVRFAHHPRSLDKLYAGSKMCTATEATTRPSRTVTISHPK